MGSARRGTAAGFGWIDRVTEDSIHLRVAVDAAPAAVFKALTDPDDLAEWFAESAEVDLDGNRYAFWGRYAPNGAEPRQQLLAAQPATSLRYTWALGGDSTVDLTLEPSGDGCVITLRHDSVPADLAHALTCFWYVTLANLVAFAEGLQTMPPFDFSVPAQGDALVRTVIDVPPEEVYASLLDPAQVDKWARGTASVEAEVGGRYDFGWDHGPERIVELDPEKTLAYSWRYPDHPDTLVRWTLRGSRGSTFITLVHSGFTDDALAEKYRQGWPPFLVELKRILEQGDRWQPMKL
jgi:uncharacterized protein YndB with AHSA1/START domain